MSIKRLCIVICILALLLVLLTYLSLETALFLFPLVAAFAAIALTICVIQLALKMIKGKKVG